MVVGTEVAEVSETKQISKFQVSILFLMLFFLFVFLNWKSKQVGMQANSCGDHNVLDVASK